MSANEDVGVGNCPAQKLHPTTQFLRRTIPLNWGIMCKEEGAGKNDKKIF